MPLASAAAAGTGGLIEILFVVAAGFYFLPTIIGAYRKVVNIGSVAAVNLLLGWTLLGWVVALALALRTNPPYAYSRLPQQTGVGHPPGWYQDPEGGNFLRWWNGTRWTENKQEGWDTGI